MYLFGICEKVSNGPNDPLIFWGGLFFWQVFNIQLSLEVVPWWTVSMGHHIRSHLTPQETSLEISIKVKKDTYNFRDATSSLKDSKRPKITKENVRALAPVTTIVKPWNSDLPPNLKILASVELSDLPLHLWKFTPPTDTESHDRTMVKIVQFLLTDFCSKYYRNPAYQPRTERTFWIDRVVPIFQIFGNHSQLLGFQWCVVSTDEHMEFIMDPGYLDA
ncbi:uncharacterized protein EV154DRAFT_554142 [Mucor mucedo]|uniref:uncharacterized protein n=1 Tax=Mucor mucedo TaxID=29922 RepID=UPI00221E9D00|nr:uncharacterized protein EV154DRAFT_554142 [Mucor mucedo]KAI7888139.1 hypothetical protein EV154DRAFT_554142 [Mucor mucedo]